jgi:hypothetical protein
MMVVLFGRQSKSLELGLEVEKDKEHSSNHECQ